MSSACFFAPNIANYFSSARSGSAVGGAETQMHLLATSLARRTSVEIIVQGADGLVHQGIRFVDLDLTSAKNSSGIRAAWRFLRESWRALGKIQSGVVIQRAAGIETFLVAVWARINGRKFVYHWASDLDVDGQSLKSRPVQRAAFWMGRRLAHLNICQTKQQASSIGNRRCVIFSNIIDGTPPPASVGDAIVWIGTVRPEWKGVDTLLRICRKLPSRRFVVYGKLRGPAVFQEYFTEAVSTLANLEFKGFVEPLHRDKMFQGARLLLSTSSVEGFSNVILEALARGVPVASLNHDPDSLLSSGSGRFADGDELTLCHQIEELFEDVAYEDAKLEALRSSPNYTAVSQIARYHQILEDVQCVES